MGRKVILTKNAPQPKGPYSQAILYNGILFISGQLPIDPKTDKPIRGTIEEETTRVLENIKAIVTEAGGDMNNILKMNCYLANMDDFQGFNHVYTSYFSSKSPARTTIQAARLSLDARVEIDAVVAL